MTDRKNPTLTIEQLAEYYGLFLCVECGKCDAVCPMGEIFDDFSYEISPRGVIETVLFESDLSLLHDDRFWFCLTCDLCTNLCPAGVRFRDFVEAFRLVALEAGAIEHGMFCAGCDTYLCPEHTVQYLRTRLGEDPEQLLSLCPTCRQHDFGARIMASLPGKANARSTDTLPVEDA